VGAVNTESHNDAARDVPPTGDGEPVAGEGNTLWTGDRGTLPEPSRKALLTLLRGPYLSAERHPQLWSALLADENAIVSRLHDVFCDLVVDREGGFAFIRSANPPDFSAPHALRTTKLSFLGSAMVLVLRQMLSDGNGVDRVFADKDEVFDHLRVYEHSLAHDESSFRQQLESAWAAMERAGLVRKANTTERVEISPVLRFVFGIEQVRAIREEYRRLAEGGPRFADPSEADSDEEAEPDESA
jgi:hypothetical protein